MTEIETSFQQAVEAFNSSNLDLAIDLFKTTVSLSPDHADAYNYLGQAHFKKEEYQDSVSSFKKALEIEPTHVQAKENLGVAQWKLGNLSETTSEPAENIEDVNQDTLHRSPDFPSQYVAPEINETDGQVDPEMSPVIVATESEQSKFIRNSQITFMARSTLKGNWVKAALATFVYFLIFFGTRYICGLVSPNLLSLLLGTELVAVSETKLEFPYSLLNSFLAGFLHSFVAAAFALGLTIYILAAYRTKSYQMNLIFAGFQYYFLVLFAHWLIYAFVGVGLVVFIIPAIIISLALTRVNFIIADNPDISALEALKKSNQMMKGFKWKYCCLTFRFIGWLILGVLTLGIGLLWVTPYFLMSAAIFYENISMASTSQNPQALESETITPEKQINKKANSSESRSGNLTV